ncbi:MAG TPA: DNA polymerase III subunit gamma/tau [Bacteroidia bacterium]|nr:DNA polymerase III subunit gamma/tau [Bacteroidia bacterium]
MEKFVVSARKYRPSTFDSVVGQSHITITLKNAIKSNHLAQAFLFCGPRGVGKTTSARILAKTINCFNVDTNTEPCNVCESCVSFNEGRSLNILELDAASNNSVEDIRNLVDQVRFVPQIGKYKVFIIDEVHMLSNAAFNAFLKTLEEPPPHAIFILATTEKHKIIPTILSRCQIFDFNRIKVEDMANHLAQIAHKENITYENDGLHVIAQKADGALRDALSMFDQIVTFAGNHVSYKAVIENLNILDYDYYFKLTDFLLVGDISSSLLLYNEILSNGFEGNFFVNGLAQHLRNLLVSRDAVTLQLLETSPGIKEKYKNQSSRCELSFLIKGLEICTKTEAGYKISVNQRLLVELALMQLCTLQGLKLDSEKKKSDTSITEAIATTPVENKAAPTSYNMGSKTSAHLTAELSVVTEAKSDIAPQVNVSNTTEPKPEIKKVISPKNFSIGKPSIASMLNQSKVSDKDEAVQNVLERKTIFTEDQLQASWAAYAKQIDEKGKTSLWHTLTVTKPILKENFVILFKVYNAVQESDIQFVLTDLSTQLRNDLQNDYLQVVLEVSKDESERKPYTNREKYMRLVQINPNLEKLKISLDLEI